MKMQMQFTCVSPPNVKKLIKCIEESREITRRTFLKYVDREEMRQIEASLNYASHPKKGLTMASDWAVRYYKSKYNGKPCVYFDWSAIEHIFF